jgi:anti-anti-sigma factor
MAERPVASHCQVRYYADGAQALALLIGALRMRECERVKQLLVDLMVPEIRCLNLHLGSLVELDSAGLGVLVGLHMTSRKNKQELRILSPTPYQIRLFETTRLSKLLNILGGADADAVRVTLEKPEFEIELETEQ